MHCSEDMCCQSIQTDYDRLCFIIRLADSALPRRNRGKEKDWWSPLLSDLKRQSIECQKLWIDHGRPRQGLIHQERLQVRAAYRNAIRAAQKAPTQKAWDRVHAAMEVCDTNDFWQS